jgi:hypothetical protein
VGESALGAPKVANVETRHISMALRLSIIWRLSVGDHAAN